MKNILSGLLLLIALPAVAQQELILGFSKDSRQAEVGLEQKYDAVLKAENLDGWMKRMTARPHHLGSAFGKSNAEYLRDLFNGWGYDAKLEVYKVLFPTPKVRLLEMIAPLKFTARLVEPALTEDATSGQSKEQLPTYNAWSADGDVMGELVFVNYGVPADYEELERLGINVKGKIVIAKYGGSWRGIKPKVAQEHGAIGCVIYSDPKEDGYYQGDVYPKGAFKNQFGTQRGSVIDMPIAPGDPLTPGIGATEDAKRIERSNASNLLKIPVLPISYSDAQPLLANLGGPVAPESWRGALPITYHIGPGLSKVHLQLQFDWKIVDCYNVIARMAGAEFPDEWVIRGNHHDGWVNGAADPISGLVAELEEARAVSQLVKGGWKPQRTIIYCAWDGEEPGLIGSTEWAEHHAKELQQKAVAYINTDGNGRGFLNAEGSGSLETMMTQIARDVVDPETGASVLERSRSLAAQTAVTAKAKRIVLDSRSMSFGALGSGSDFSGFIHHLGIPSVNLGFGGEDGGGEYHSIYDSYDNYKRFKDPTFTYGVALAKTAGRATLRFANAEIPPFDFLAYQKTIDGYLGELITLLDNSRENTEVENQMIKERRYLLAADPTKNYSLPLPKDAVPFLDFSALQNAIANLRKSANAYADWLALSPAPPANRGPLNRVLYQAEQKLLDESGLPRRSWYKHTICAPGYYTGYAAKTLPGIREAIEQRNWSEAQTQIAKVAIAINNFAAEIDQAVKIWTGSIKP